MHRRSLSELQGARTPRTTQVGASPRGKPGGGAPLWAWVLLGALLAPGAWSEQEDELLVELHNRYRGLVSPSASAMLPLKWDPALKVIAESYAAKCIWNHNPELTDVGENLFAGNGPLDLAEALEKWFLERLDYNYDNNSCDEEKMCGHYTQMVWADTHRVGCAIHLCSSMEGLDWEKINFLVCNYYPAGNFEDERPYVEGDWCSQCPENFQKCENNLCVPDTEEEEPTDEPSSQPTEFLPESSDAPDRLPDSTPSIPSIPRIPSTVVPGDAEDTPPPGTAAADPPRAPSATPGQEEEAVEEKEKKREESTNRKDETWEKINTRKIPTMQTSAAAALTLSAMLASLTGLLTLWL